MAASAVAVASAQVIPGCTTNSFSIPSWWLSNLKIEKDVLTFDLVNRANNATTNASCVAYSTGSSNCSLPNAAEWSGEPDPVKIQVVDNKATVTLQQTWQCNDRSRLYFVAEGNATLPLNCTNTSCTAANPQTLIRGSLTTPIYVTPEYSEGPPGHANAGCLAAASSPSWSVSRIDVRELSGAGLDPNDYRTVEALIVNDFNGYTASCFLNDAATGALNCAGVEFQGNPGERYRITTSATWNKEKNEFQVSQTWFCDDADAAKPVSVSASGSQIIELNCVDRSLEWEGIPEGHRRICESEGTATVNGTLTSSTPLPPYSLTDPVLQADSCTVASILDPKWTFSNFRILTSNNASAVAFNVILSAPRRGFANPIEITQDLSAADPNADEGFYPCVIAEPDFSVTPLWPTYCEVRYLKVEKRLTMRAEWNCSDLDGKRPTHFLGNVDTVVNSGFVCESVEGGEECTTENPGLSWTVGMTGVQWFPVAYPE